MPFTTTYNEIRETLPDEVNFGCGGIKLFADAEMEQGQVGYAVDASGTSLCSDEVGTWRRNWVVIGYETGCGDPLFIDTNDPSLPVFTAMHGEEAWEPKQIARSLDAFVQCVQEFSRIALGRSNPVQREANPVRADERTAYQKRIAQLNQPDDAPEFWDLLLEF